MEQPEDAASSLVGSPLASPGITVLVGHAGVGKTNLALNLALAQARAGMSVTLADLDLVNPYFRSSDYVDTLEDAGVKLVAPLFARTSLDTPSMGGELDGAIASAQTGDSAAPRLVIDVGGDDLGATALGRYARALDAAGARLLYVVNAFRTLTATPQEAVEVLRAIEGNAHLQAYGVVNCSNLAGQTSVADVERGRSFARDVAALADLPLVATVVPTGLADTYAAGTLHEPLIFVERFVRPPWE